MVGTYSPELFGFKSWKNVQHTSIRNSYIRQEEAAMQCVVVGQLEG